MEEIAAMLPGRTEGAVSRRWSEARIGRSSTAALRAYAAECTPPENRSPWSVEEDQTFIQAHKEGKTYKEIAAMLQGRTYDAVRIRWQEARNGKSGTAALIEYAAEFTASGRSCPWSVEEDQIFIEAHKGGKTLKEIAAMLPGRTRAAVFGRWHGAKKGEHGAAALLAYAAAYCKLKRPISREDHASLM